MRNLNNFLKIIEFYSNFLTLVIRYKTEFGFSIDGRLVIVDDIRVRGIAKTGIQTVKTLPTASSPATAVAVHLLN